MLRWLLSGTSRMMKILTSFHGDPAIPLHHLCLVDVIPLLVSRATIAVSDSHHISLVDLMDLRKPICPVHHRCFLTMILRAAFIRFYTLAEPIQVFWVDLVRVHVVPGAGPIHCLPHLQQVLPLFICELYGLAFDVDSLHWIFIWSCPPFRREVFRTISCFV